MPVLKFLLWPSRTVRIQPSIAVEIARFSQMWIKTITEGKYSYKHQIYAKGQKWYYMNKFNNNSSYYYILTLQSYCSFNVSVKYKQDCFLYLHKCTYHFSRISVFWDRLGIQGHWEHVIHRKLLSCVIYLCRDPKSPKSGLWKTLGHFLYPNGPSHMPFITQGGVRSEGLNKMLSSLPVQFASARYKQTPACPFGLSCGISVYQIDSRQPS